LETCAAASIQVSALLIPRLYLFIIRNDEMLPLENTIGAAGLQTPRLIH
jgi:hypothetical protein